MLNIKKSLVINNEESKVLEVHCSRINYSDGYKEGVVESSNFLFLYLSSNRVFAFLATWNEVVISAHYIEYFY